MWARLHKIDRIKPMANGGATVFIEDERTPPQIQRMQSVSTLIAVARVLNAKQALDAKYGGKGEIRYMVAAGAPSFLVEAVARAGSHVVDRDRDKVEMAAQPASVDALVDVAFSELAHSVKVNLDAPDIAAALTKLEQQRRKSPLDRETQSHLYWPAVFELGALAGETSRRHLARWVEAREMPVPFVLRLGDQGVARPLSVAQKIVEGAAVDEPISPP
jgi:hypothetical protein